ncbi:cellulose binding domain-containing protein, partial [Streptomyces sp. MB09-01]|uniref:cellulose binding domain-containing protein n=1 Tax=Streptomyces sp. MB09-01 TaxID=3028666 RepID=UPI0029AB0975
MGSTVGHRRRTSRRAKVTGAIVAAAVIGGAVFAFTGTAQAASVGAVYTKSSSWSGGYTGQYVITNHTGQVQSDWTLQFDLPAGTKIDSLWNGTHTVSGRRVTVKPASWNRQLAAGASVTVGFVTSGSDSPGNPTGCLINGVKCSVDQGATAQPSGRPTARPTVTATAAPTAPATSAAPTRTTAPSPTPTPTA